MQYNVQVHIRVEHWWWWLWSSTTHRQVIKIKCLMDLSLCDTVWCDIELFPNDVQTKPRTHLSTKHSWTGHLHCSVTESTIATKATVCIIEFVEIPGDIRMVLCPQQFKLQNCNVNLWPRINNLELFGSYACNARTHTHAHNRQIPKHSLQSTTASTNAKDIHLLVEWKCPTNILRLRCGQDRMRELPVSPRCHKRWWLYRHC